MAVPKDFEIILGLDSTRRVSEVVYCLFIGDSLDQKERKENDLIFSYSKAYRQF